MTVPIALCGKSAVMATTFSTSMSSKSSYKITHVCHDLPSALNELPALFRGEVVHPSSDLSVKPSSDSKQPLPRAVVIGKGFSEDEMKEIVRAGQATEYGKGVAWMLPDDDKFTAYMKAKAIVTAGTGLPAVIADRAVQALKENGVVEGQDFKGGVYGF
ncbi:hypothetical protein MBLNU457_6252t1 [Dothideomycetes sp. NU457]